MHKRTGKKSYFPRNRFINFLKSEASSNRFVTAVFQHWLFVLKEPNTGSFFPSCWFSFKHLKKALELPHNTDRTFYAINTDVRPMPAIFQSSVKLQANILYISFFCCFVLAVALQIMLRIGSQFNNNYILPFFSNILSLDEKIAFWFRNIFHYLAWIITT